MVEGEEEERKDAEKAACLRFRVQNVGTTKEGAIHHSAAWRVPIMRQAPGRVWGAGSGGGCHTSSLWRETGCLLCARVTWTGRVAAGPPRETGDRDDQGYSEAESGFQMRRGE